MDFRPNAEHEFATVFFACTYGRERSAVRQMNRQQFFGDDGELLEHICFILGMAAPAHKGRSTADVALICFRPFNNFKIIPRLRRFSFSRRFHSLSFAIACFTSFS